MIANKNVEIEEQEGGTYVFPVLSAQQDYSWALYVYKDGHAELYLNRSSKTGALKGKPIDLPIRWKRPGQNCCDHETESIPKGDLRNPYKSDNMVCKHCHKEFRKA